MVFLNPIFQNEAKENLSDDQPQEQPGKTGDGQLQLCLPTIPGSVHDLHNITPETLSSLLENGYQDVVKSFRIIDCRYPYEYAGGHIKVILLIYVNQIMKFWYVKVFDYMTREIHVVYTEFTYLSSRACGAMRLNGGGL